MRVNVGIPPVVLDDWRLIAEIEELVDVVAFYVRRSKIQKFDDIPSKFRLGDGHIKFFLDKGKYLMIRRDELWKEYNKRNLVYKIPPSIREAMSRYYMTSLYNVKHWKNYEPTLRDKQIIVNRIISKIKTSKIDPSYYGKQETRREAIDRLLSVAPSGVEQTAINFG